MDNVIKKLLKGCCHRGMALRALRDSLASYFGRYEALLVLFLIFIVGRCSIQYLWPFSDNHRSFMSDFFMFKTIMCFRGRIQDFFMCTRVPNIYV